jgi:hypothetical protein
MNRILMFNKPCNISLAGSILCHYIVPNVRFFFFLKLSSNKSMLEYHGLPNMEQLSPVMSSSARPFYMVRISSVKNVIIRRAKPMTQVERTGRKWPRCCGV